MTAVFLTAIGSSFAFKVAKGPYPGYSVNIGNATTVICTIRPVNTGCETFYTGPQCTANLGASGIKPIWEVSLSGPSCVTPLRQFFQ